VTNEDIIIKFHLYLSLRNTWGLERDFMRRWRRRYEEEEWWNRVTEGVDTWALVLIDKLLT